ncbi:unnamed protein product, partial [Meganyctiphanes norvegica]
MTDKEQYQLDTSTLQKDSPTCSKESIRILVALASSKKWLCHTALQGLGGYYHMANRTKFPVYMNISTLIEIYQQAQSIFELWQFNLISGSWHRLENVDNGMPEELASHCAVAQGPSMLVYGGTAMPFGDSSSNAVHICHLPSGRWQRIHTEGQRPDPMYGQAACLSEDKLYIVGGTTGYDYSIDVHCLDLNTMVWEYLLGPRIMTPQNFLPEERYRHEVVEYEGALYVFGGGRADATCDLSTIPTFLIDEREWTKTQTQPDRVTHNSPQKRRCHVTCKLGSFEVYVHGRYDWEGLHGGLKLAVCLAKQGTVQWQLVTRTQRHNHCLEQCGRMLVFGGVKNIDPSMRTPSVSAVWLGIGRLRDICWDALCHYLPNICNLPPSQLLQMGIPFAIVDALQQQQSPAG